MIRIILLLTVKIKRSDWLRFIFALQHSTKLFNIIFIFFLITLYNCFYLVCGKLL